MNCQWIARDWLNTEPKEQSKRGVEFLLQVLRNAVRSPGDQSKRSLNSLAAPVSKYLLMHSKGWEFCSSIGFTQEQGHVRFTHVETEVLNSAIHVLEEELVRLREETEARDPMQLLAELRILRTKHRAMADQETERKRILEEIKSDQRERERARQT